MNNRLRQHLKRVIDRERNRAKEAIELVIREALPSKFGELELDDETRVANILKAIRRNYVLATESILAASKEASGEAKDPRALDLIKDAMIEFLDTYRGRLDYFVYFPRLSPIKDSDKMRFAAALKKLASVEQEASELIDIASFHFGEAPTKPRPKPVLESELEKWWFSLNEDDRNFLNEEIVWQMAKARFPEHSVSRDAVREFTKGRKVGRPPTRGN